VNRRTIRKDVLGIAIFIVGIKLLLDRESDIGLLVGLVLILFGWVSLMRSEREADTFARRILGNFGISPLDERLAHSRQPEEE
jgi:hypothetical protein